MKRTLIAAAVLSTMAVGTAYAEERDCAAGCDPAALFTATNIHTDIGEFGFIRLRGHVDVNSSSGATVNNTQSVNLGGTRLEPPPQSYTSGTVTTTINTEKQWANASGSGSGWGTSSSVHASDWARGETEASSSNWSKGASFVAGGGFAKGYQSSYAGYNYLNTHHAADGFIAASFIAGLGGGPCVIFGGFAAGFTAELNTHASDSFGGAFAKQSSGYGAAWGGYAASGYRTHNETESESGYRYSSSYDAHSHAYGWSSSASEDAGYIAVNGTITEHIDTRTPTNLVASMGDGALSGATGNIGVNIAAGANNAQSNDAALAHMDVGPVFGNAQIFSAQSSSGHGTIGDFNLVAAIGDGALADATGNVGVNIASGLGNVQNNSLAVSATTDSSTKKHGQGGEVIASDQNCQTADAKVNGTFMGTASIGAGALAGASGNIGVNIAVGGGNLQHNGLAIASVSH